jgi:hypothetical protein
VARYRTRGRHYFDQRENASRWLPTFERQRAKQRIGNLRERYGGAQILDGVFTGFTTLPAPGQSSCTWREVIGAPPNEHNLDVVKHVYRMRAGELHPTAAARTNRWELNVALKQAEEALR